MMGGTAHKNDMGAGLQDHLDSRFQSLGWKRAAVAIKKTQVVWIRGPDY